jgi:hypothetical protein
MIARPKQIVIDKSAFEAINLDALCDFAKHHLLVAPGVLLYECATSPRRQERKLLQRYERLIKEGACCCPMASEFTQWEGWRSRPYPACLADMEDMTARICREEVRLDEMLKPGDARMWEYSRTRGACVKYIELSEKLKQRVAQDCPNLREEIKVFPTDQSARFRLILDRIASFDIHEMAIRSFPSAWIKVEEKFCLSDEWISWHRVRLGSALAYEYWHKNQTKSFTKKKETDAEHDDQDVEYVLLLSRADAIITTEGEKKGLVPALARAAFPEKRVFSSLDVPDEYRCDWTNG